MFPNDCLCSNLFLEVPESVDQVVGSIVCTGKFGLYKCTKTPGLVAMLRVSRFVFIAIVLHVDVECWVCDL